MYCLSLKSTLALFQAIALASSGDPKPAVTNTAALSGQDVRRSFWVASAVFTVSQRRDATSLLVADYASHAVRMSFGADSSALSTQLQFVDQVLRPVLSRRRVLRYEIPRQGNIAVIELYRALDSLFAETPNDIVEATEADSITLVTDALLANYPHPSDQASLDRAIVSWDQLSRSPSVSRAVRFASRFSLIRALLAKDLRRGEAFTVLPPADQILDWETSLLAGLQLLDSLLPGNPVVRSMILASPLPPSSTLFHDDLLANSPLAVSRSLAVDSPLEKTFQSLFDALRSRTPNITASVRGVLPSTLPGGPDATVTEILNSSPELSAIPAVRSMSQGLGVGDDAAVQLGELEAAFALVTREASAQMGQARRLLAVADAAHTIAERLRLLREVRRSRNASAATDAASALLSNLASLGALANVPAITRERFKTLAVDIQRAGRAITSAIGAGHNLLGSLANAGSVGSTILGPISRTVGAIATGNLFGAFKGILSLFGKRGSDKEVLRAVQGVHQEIRALGQEMNSRFDRVDAELGGLMDTMLVNFAILRVQTAIISEQLAQVEEQVVEIRSSVARIELSVARIEDRLVGIEAAFDDQFARQILVEDAAVRFDCERAAVVDSVITFSLPICLRRALTDAAFLSTLFPASTNSDFLGRKPIGRQLNTLNKWLNEEVGVSAGGATTIPDPAVWAEGALTYLALAGKYEDQYLQLPKSDTRDQVDRIISRGEQTRDFLSRLSQRREADLPIASAVLKYYGRWLDSLYSKIDAVRCRGPFDSNQSISDLREVIACFDRSLKQNQPSAAAMRGTLSALDHWQSFAIITFPTLLTTRDEWRWALLGSGGPFDPMQWQSRCTFSNVQERLDREQDIRVSYRSRTLYFYYPRSEKDLLNTQSFCISGRPDFHLQDAIVATSSLIEGFATQEEHWRDTRDIDRPTGGLFSLPLYWIPPLQNRQYYLGMDDLLLRLRALRGRLGRGAQ